jgi:glycerophosphoryl diester phosphodiesterase
MLKICTALLLIVSISGCLQVKQSAAWLSQLTSGPGFDLQGHRGARGHYPENTLPAFQYALSLGVTTLELDVGLSADHVLVVAHDRHLNGNIMRSANGETLPARGPTIRSLDWPTLSRYDLSNINRQADYSKNFPQQRIVPGTRMLRLEDLFNYTERSGYNKVRFNIETKLSPLAPEETASAEAFSQALISLVRQAKLSHRVTIQSFDWRTLQIVQRDAPEIATVYLSSEQASLDTMQKGKPTASPWAAGFDIKQTANSTPLLVKAAGGLIWSPNHLDLTQATLAEAKTAELRVIPWTVNEPADISRLIDWGVDGLISDYPERVVAELKKRGRVW